MKTDWNLISEAMNAALDRCERLETLGYTEEHRGLTVEVSGTPVSVYEFLISAWTMPEIVKYQVIRQRHDEKTDLSYVPEAARILTAVTAACAELVGAGDCPPAQAPIRGMTQWYLNHFNPNLEKALAP